MKYQPKYILFDMLNKCVYLLFRAFETVWRAALAMILLVDLHWIYANLLALTNFAISDSSGKWHHQWKPKYDLDSGKYLEWLSFVALERFSLKMNRTDIRHDSMEGHK